MKQRFITVISALTLIIVPCLVMAAEMKDSDCYECHKDLKGSFAKGSVHDPVAEGDCGSCHADHGDKNKLTLTEEVPKLCYSCHDEMTGAHVHSPVAEGSCLDCHKVHNAESSGLLTKAVPDLCTECHDAPKKKSVHQPVADGDCLDCHASHQSAEANLLTKPEGDLCADCHSSMDHSKGAAPHDPVAGGECSECHSSHESDNAPLLTARYLQERYALYSSENYSLCFNCHEKKVFEDKSAVDGTDFRNGSTNLHYLHVAGIEEVNKYGLKKKKEGMACMGCHITHGTEQPKLIRVTLECGPTFCYTMNFRKFEGGGSCVVGCHKPKIYKVSGVNVSPSGAQEIQPVAQAAPGGSAR